MPYRSLKEDWKLFKLLKHLNGDKPLRFERIHGNTARLQNLMADEIEKKKQVNRSHRIGK